MTFVAGRPWDMYRAELADTKRGSKDARIKRPCVYCGTPTKALSRVCLAHDDLIDLDAGYPAALEDTRAATAPDADGLPQGGLASPPALVSSSAAKSSSEPDRTNGKGPSGAALDSSEPDATRARVDTHTARTGSVTDSEMT